MADNGSTKLWSLSPIPLLALPNQISLPARLGSPPSGSAKGYMVYFITSTQCPVARQYASRMQALGTEFGARGIRFVLLNPNDSESEAAFSARAKEPTLTLPRIKDPHAKLAQKLGEVRYPEAIIVDRQAAQVRVPYVKRVPEALLEDKPAPWRVITSTEGCEITFSLSKPSMPSVPALSLLVCAFP
ncbi:MAG: redoxin domain-containing protein [Armatimonadetes bacterium]|nr:redoxin domain-containing protein [Armatimonadota bacterium]